MAAGSAGRRLPRRANPPRSRRPRALMNMQLDANEGAPGCRPRGRAVGAGPARPGSAWLGPAWLAGCCRCFPRSLRGCPASPPPSFHGFSATAGPAP